MKTIFINKAIISYVEFMRKIIVMKKNPGDEKTNALYHEFIIRYRQMKNHKEILDSVSEVRCSSFINPSLIKIYYVNMPQLWAFLHLVVEDISGKRLSLSFDYKPDDFEAIKGVFKCLWFIEKKHYSCSFIYLEDGENEVDLELKLFHTKKTLEQCRDNLGLINNCCDVLKFGMENGFQK